MSEDGAALQQFTHELVKSIEELKLQEIDLNVALNADLVAKNKLQKQMDELNRKINKLNESIERKETELTNVKKRLELSSIGFQKILEIAADLSASVRKCVTNNNVDKTIK